MFAVRCLQMHWFKSTTSDRFISSSFPNNLTNVIIYPKTRFSFGRLGYTLLEFIILIMPGMALQCSFMQPLWKKTVSTIHMLFLCSFTHTNNIWHHNIWMRLIVCMFVLCIAYVCVSLCCSSDLPWHVKIATPTALSPSASPNCTGYKIGPHTWDPGFPQGPGNPGNPTIP